MNNLNNKFANIVYSNYRYIVKVLDNYQGDNYIKAKIYMESFLTTYIKNYKLKSKYFKHNLYKELHKFDNHLEFYDKQIDNLKKGEHALQALEYLTNQFSYLKDIYSNSKEDEKIADSLMVKSILEFPNNRKYEKNYQIVYFIQDSLSKVEQLKNTNIISLNENELLQFLITKNYSFVYKYIAASKQLNFRNMKKVAEKTLYYIIKDSLESCNIYEIEKNIESKLDNLIQSLSHKQEYYRLEFLARHNDKYAINKIIELNIGICEKYAQNCYQEYLKLIDINQKKDKKIVIISYEDIFQEMSLYMCKIVNEYFEKNHTRIFSGMINTYLDRYINTMLFNIKKDLKIDNTCDDLITNVYENIELLDSIKNIKGVLTKSEKKYFDLLASGNNYKEISAELGVTYHSARTKVYDVRKKVKKII